MDELAPQFLYEFGEFQLDAQRRVLRSRHGGQPLELTPKALATLLYLVEHAGQVVEKQALFAAVWPNVVVEEGNLTQTIHVLRRALGEHPDDHRFIVTVPGRGYRFVTDVVRLTQPPPAVEQTPYAAPVARARPRSIALLALACVLGAALVAVAWYGRWFTPESAQQAAQVSLPDVPDSYALYGLDAHLQFRQGQALIASRKVADAEGAIQRFSRVIEIAPRFAAAYVALAGAHRHLASLIDEACASPGMQAAQAKASPLLAHALALDDSLGEAYVLRADLKNCSGDHAGAEADFRKGLELNPGYGAGHERFAEFLAGLGRSDEALAEIDKAINVDPETPRNYYLKGLFLVGLGRLEEAEAHFLRALKFAPDFPPALMRLASLRAYSQGQFAEGIKLAEHAVAIDARAPWMLTRPVHFYLEIEDVDAARAFVAEQPESVRPALWLPICLYEKQPERAAEMLRANPQRWSDRMSEDVETYVLRDAAPAHGSLARLRTELPALLKGSRGYIAIASAQLSFALGDRREGERLAREVLADEEVDTHARAIAHALLGESEAAIGVLAQEFERGGKRWWYVFDREPAFEGLRRDPRFQVLAARARAHAAEQLRLLEQMRERGEVPRRAVKATPAAPC